MIALYHGAHWILQGAEVVFEKVYSPCCIHLSVLRLWFRLPA